MVDDSTGRGTPDKQKQEKQDFDATKLDRTKIALPLLEDLAREKGKDPNKPVRVIIDLNMSYVDGLEGAREEVHKLIGDAYKDSVDTLKGEYCPQYVFAKLTPNAIESLARRDTNTKDWTRQAIYKIWPDFEVKPLLHESIATVKADAARVAFDAIGTDIVWAVLDTGIAGDHPHFTLHKNLELKAPLAHHDFTLDKALKLKGLPKDPNGHGTHVAGIIGGETKTGKSGRTVLRAASARRTESGKTVFDRWHVGPISGLAPRVKLVSLRVLGANADASGVSNLLAAIGYIQKVNNYGRWPLIHGVNLSVGYGFDPEWFGCGHSPLCVEVDRLVRSGVSVVVAAGNTGYWKRSGDVDSPKNAGLDLTINDPGNAELAITVGATHREKPHTYGVAYFSSKGPTGDGRLKPDLVAPGEKILSCAAGAAKKKVGSLSKGVVHYREESGTSMAAPHVSGAIAAFLSIRPEFKGEPERVKEIFLQSATDLGRERYFQGHGLVDLMRAIQSV